MRKIIKGAEPKSLTEHRSQPGSKYEDYNDKQTLRECLVGEQRGLCCYCLSRIRAEISSMKIEHWHCQSRYPLEQLTYSNLLGSCKGNEGPYGNQRCDTRKADHNLKWNPANPQHSIEKVTFFVNGMIGSSDPEFNAQISSEDSVLNLNQAFLVVNRKFVLDSFVKALPRMGTLSHEAWERLRQDWSGESHTRNLEPFCQVIVYWLQKKLRRS